MRLPADFDPERSTLGLFDLLTDFNAYAWFAMDDRGKPGVIGFLIHSLWIFTFHQTKVLSRAGKRETFLED